MRISLETGEIEDYVVTSSYGRTKEQLQWYMDHMDMYYLNPDKKRTDAWLSVLGLQLPSSTIKYGSIKKIPQKKLGINPKNTNKGKKSAKDSTGRELSEGQQDYFKDSKVRDENGNLLVMYHGTDAYEEFNVFKKGKSGYLGPGIYLSSSKQYAERYAKQHGYEGRVYETYINIKNPLIVTSDNPAREMLGDKVASNREKKNSFSTKWITNADIKKLQEKGYDGIIWKYGETPIEVSVWESNQIKKIDNLNPTDNQDIRYSFKDSGIKYSEKEALENEQRESELEKETTNEVASILEEGFEALKENSKLEFSDSLIRTIAERYIKQYKSNYKVSDFAKGMKAVFAYIRDHEVNYEDMVRVMRDLAMPVVQASDNLDKEWSKEYEDFRKYVKGMKISLDDSQKAEVALAYGSYENFRRSVFGTLAITDKGTNIDSLWNEIAEQSGYMLDPEENSNTQILALVDFLDEMKSVTIKDAGTLEQEAYTLALNIYSEYFKMADESGIDYANDIAKKDVALRKQLKEKAKKELDEIYKIKENEIARLKILIKSLRDNVLYSDDGPDADLLRMAELEVQLERTKEQLRSKDKTLQYTRASQLERIAKLKAAQAESRRKQAEERRKTKTKNQIRAIVKDLSSRINNPTEGHHVPAKMVQATISVLEAINLNTREAENMQEKIKDLQIEYNKLSESLKDNPFADYDAGTAIQIQRLAQIFEGRSLVKLTEDELNEVYNVVKPRSQTERKFITTVQSMVIQSGLT